MALKPLDEAFGITRFFATSLQAVSGAGYPGLPFMDMADNVIPLIKGEEEKLRIESCLLLGKLGEKEMLPAQIKISAQCNRVPVQHGHTVCLSVEFKNKPSVKQALEALENYQGPEIARDLPSAPAKPVLLSQRPDGPQPRPRPRHR